MEVPNIKTEIPGPKSRKIMEEAQKYLVTTTRGRYMVISKMENDLVWDIDGNVFIDFAASIAVANVGHRNPEIVNAIKEQLERYIHVGPHDWYDELQYEYAKKLVKYTPGSFPKKVFFGNSGTESVEAALKIARWNRKAPLILGFYGAFHGRTYGSLAITASKNVHKKNLFPYGQAIHAPYAYCYRCPFNRNPDTCNADCADFIGEWIFEKLVAPEDVAAIIMEPFQGEGGYIIPPKKFVQKVYKIAKDHGILFIADEVQTGFARSGKLWAIEHFGVEPDVLCTAKAIAGGLPLGATVVRSDLDFKYQGAHSSTFGGNALSLAAANAALDYIIKNKLWERAEKLGNLALRRLSELKDEVEIVGDVRGMGLFIGIEIVKDKKTKVYGVEERNAIEKLAYKKGLIILPAGKSVIRIAPPLTITDEHFDKGLEILVEAIKEVDRERR